MAKKKTTTKRFSIQGFDAAHYRTTEQYANAVNALFDRATAEITKAAAAGTYDPDKPFMFADYPGMNKTVESVTKQLATNVQVVIETGSKKQWLFACQKNDKYLASIMDTSKLSKARLAKMQDRNLDALGSFQQRKVDGMDLSQRVWKYVGQYKEQIESALDVGLGEGRSAQQLARDVKQNLRDPNRLFRRVRDKRGNLVLSKNAQAFHPGRGVYRSSVKNAQRLTRSEINMAYRESDWQRWQQLDFVVGFEIHRSNHEPLCKCLLCERLVGRYPKWFKFKGFHPQCMCFCTPILMDEETFDENELGDLKSALFGTEYKHQAAKNAVVDVPDGFKKWVKDNIEAQENWSSTPYFIRDNFVDGSLAKGLKVTPETYVDPWKEQLAALQPSIIAAKALAQQWGLDGQIVDLDAAIANKDAKSINATILRINTMCKQYQRDYSAFVSVANATLEELANLGVDILGEEKTRLQRYLDTLANDKTQWNKNGSFYQSDLEELKEKIKSYKASPLASMPLAYQEEVADIRNRIAKAKEWGIKTTDADAALRTFLDNPTRENYYQMQNAEFKLWDKIQSAENKVLKLVSDANALMKDADKFGVNTMEMSRWVFNLQGSDKSLVWAQYKRDINKCYNDLKAAVDTLKQTQTTSIQDTVDTLKQTPIEYRDVSLFVKQPTESEIIARIGGGDRTEGSCASLAMAYAANKGGMDVLDFRDGESRKYFASYTNLFKIIDKVDGFKSFSVTGIQMMKKTEIGKEYYLAVGGHAAIVRQVSKGKYEYLELQSPYSCGWKSLDSKVFGWRFSARGSCRGLIVEISKLNKAQGFREMMGYINTAEDKQQKSAKGSIK